MRGVVQGLVALMLVGCSRDNPWFVLNTAGAVDSEGSQSGGTTGDGSSQGEAGSTASSGASSDEGSTTTTTSTSTISTTTTSTTGEPETSSSSTSGSDLTSSSEGSTSTDSTTGEPGEKVLLDLYDECKVLPPNWGDDKALYGCMGDPNNFPSVARLVPMFEGQDVKAIVTYPLQLSGDFLDGTYVLDITDATHPFFHATVWMPMPADPADVMVASVFTEEDNIIPPYTHQVKVSAGIPTVLDLDLQGLVGELTSVALHVQIEVVTSKAGKAKAYWINPRVIDLP